jgi:cold shock CspA family protein
MEGIFKGWVGGKPFGFIETDDGLPNVFVHISKVSDGKRLTPGLRVAFTIEDTEKGRSALEVRLVEGTEVATRSQGRVRFWNDKGFGFIEPDGPGSDVFVHRNSLTSSTLGYLGEGDVIEFVQRPTQKGFEATDVTLIGWTEPADQLSAFADMGPPGWLETLKTLAEEEPWEYTRATSSEPLPILRNFIRYTFRRLDEMQAGIGYSPDMATAAFNTGLVTPNQEEIYALFRQNPRSGRQPWKLHGFKKASDWDLIDKFGSSPPPLASYFDDPTVLLYDRRCELYINMDHVMEHIDRFPKHIQANPYVARQLLISAEATTKKRVYRSYKTAIPQYYRERGGDGGVQLLLPICLENPARADLALVVAKSEIGNAYRGSTVLTLDMAYNNARLLARPDTEWLEP